MILKGERKKKRKKRKRKEKELIISKGSQKVCHNRLKCFNIGFFCNFNIIFMVFK